MNHDRETAMSEIIGRRPLTSALIALMSVGAYASEVRARRQPVASEPRREPAKRRVQRNAKRADELTAEDKARLAAAAERRARRNAKHAKCA